MVDRQPGNIWETELQLFLDHLEIELVEKSALMQPKLLRQRYHLCGRNADIPGDIDLPDKILH